MFNFNQYLNSSNNLNKQLNYYKYGIFNIKILKESSSSLLDNIKKQHDDKTIYLILITENIIINKSLASYFNNKINQTHI